MAQVRQLFDGVMAKFPEMKEYISKNSAILHSPAFETAVVKIQSMLCTLPRGLLFLICLYFGFLLTE